jgi:hypothetical protein
MSRMMFRAVLHQPTVAERIGDAMKANLDASSDNSDCHTRVAAFTPKTDDQNTAGGDYCDINF